MRWRYETLDEERQRRGQWYKWFAWYPVKSEGTAFWLEYVLRKDERFFSMWLSKYKKIEDEAI